MKKTYYCTNCGYLGQTEEDFFMECEKCGSKFIDYD